MEELKALAALVSAVAMPFILFILVGIRSNIDSLFEMLREHTQDDAAVASRVAVIESQLARREKAR